VGLFELSIQGRHAQGLDCARKASAEAPWSPFSIGLLAGALEVAGETGEAEALLGKVRTDAYRYPAALFCYHLVRGEKDSAVEALQQAAEKRFTCMIVIWVRPFQVLLRQCAGWSAVLEKVNLREAL